MNVPGRIAAHLVQADAHHNPIVARERHTFNPNHVAPLFHLPRHAERGREPNLIQLPSLVLARRRRMKGDPLVKEVH